MSLKNVVQSIKRHKRFLITSHTNLEGDALGSELAFYNLLKKLGKKATIVNEDKVPYGYTFLPGTEKIRIFSRNISKIRFDCFAVLDCSDLKRTGEVYRINSGNKPIINIDHHVSNRAFAQANWIDWRASSCSEMIYRIYKHMRVAFDKRAALFLYVGMLTDTGSFRYSNTASSTHKAAAELLKYGLNIPQIYKNIYENIPYEDMRMLCRVIPAMKREANGKIIWFQMKRDVLRNKKLSFDLSEHILSIGRSIKDAEVAVLFKENLGAGNEIRVNFRSQGKIDVNKVAKFFGGGGHKTASGATVKGKIDTVRRKVLAKIKENLK